MMFKSLIKAGLQVTGMDAVVKVAQTAKFTVDVVKSMHVCATKNENELVFKEIHGKRVVVDKHLLLGNGVTIAAVLPLPINGWTIVVDDAFLKLSEASQKAILAHEEGHVELGHIYKITQENVKERAREIKAGRVQAIELEADRYAADKVGEKVMIEALYELCDVFPLVNYLEIVRRVEALQK